MIALPSCRTNDVSLSGQSANDESHWNIYTERATKGVSPDQTISMTQSFPEKGT